MKSFVYQFNVAAGKGGADFDYFIYCEAVNFISEDQWSLIILSSS